MSNRKRRSESAWRAPRPPPPPATSIRLRLRRLTPITLMPPASHVVSTTRRFSGDLLRRVITARCNGVTIAENNFTGSHKAVRHIDCHGSLITNLISQNFQEAKHIFFPTIQLTSAGNGQVGLQCCCNIIKN